jgi:hypothetical protein
MPEIKPDRADTSRCISVHWTLPVQCVLPRSHRENWHQAWNPETGHRLRYRHTVHATQELRDSQWHDLQIPAPGDTCGEPRQGKPDVHCQAPRTHNQTSWTHRAAVDGRTYTWNTIRRDLTAEQERHDMAAFRRLAAEQAAEIQRLREENARLTAELKVEYNPVATPKAIIQLAQHVEPEWRQFYEDETGGTVTICSHPEDGTVRIFTSYRACRVPLGVVEAVVAALREAAHRTIQCTAAPAALEG